MINYVIDINLNNNYEMLFIKKNYLTINNKNYLKYSKN